MGGSDLKLLGAKVSSFSDRIVWALKLKGVEYEFVEEDLENKSSLLLESNPVYKKVPVLIHGGKVISESLIILEYIDEMWKHNPILPKDPQERAHARFWAKFVDEKLLEAARKALYPIGDDDQAKALESMAEVLQLVEAEMRMRLKGGRKLFGGEGIGYLDIVLGWVAYWFKYAGEAAGLNILTTTEDSATKYPTLTCWINDFLQVAVIKDNIPPPDELHRVCLKLRMLWLAKVGVA